MIGPLPWLEVSAVGNADGAHGEGIRVFRKIEGDHFASASGGSDLDGGHGHGDDGLVGGEIDHQPRDELHEEPESGKSAGDRRSIESIPPPDEQRVVQLCRAAGIGQAGKDLRGAMDAPDEMVTASA